MKKDVLNFQSSIGINDSNYRLRGYYNSTWAQKITTFYKGDVYSPILNKWINTENVFFDQFDLVREKKEGKLQHKHPSLEIQKSIIPGRYQDYYHPAHYWSILKLLGVRYPTAEEIKKLLSKFKDSEIKQYWIEDVYWTNLQINQFPESIREKAEQLLLCDRA